MYVFTNLFEQATSDTRLIFKQRLAGFLDWFPYQS